ncbi:hypothetical protein D3C83_187250 [compost metagenome]
MDGISGVKFINGFSFHIIITHNALLRKSEIDAEISRKHFVVFHHAVLHAFELDGGHVL